MFSRDFWILLGCGMIAAYAAGRCQASCQSANAAPIVQAKVVFDDREPALDCPQPEPVLLEVPCAYMGTEMDRYNDHAFLHELGLDVSAQDQWLMLCMNECYQYVDFGDCAAHCIQQELHLTCK